MEETAALRRTASPVVDPADPAWERVWSRRAYWLLLVLTVWRVVFTALHAIDITVDEAYYWDWSRRLDFGYYSKPPMIAWLIRLSTTFLGSSVLGVRLPAALLSTLCGCFLFGLTRRMFGAKVGFWTIVLAALTPAAAAAGLLMTIDAPLLAAWSGALLCFWGLLESKSRRPLWAGGLFLALGLGVLTKQTMFGFFPLAIIYLLSGSDRREFCRPTLYVVALAAVACFLPVLWWNSQHGWVTWEHTVSHFGESAAPSLLRRLSLCGEFLGAQLVVLSPLLFVLVAAAFLGATRSFRRLERRERFLLCFSAVPLAGVLLLSCKQRVEANWPAPFYLAALPLAVAWISGRTSFQKNPGRSRFVLPAAVGSGLLWTAGAYLLPLLLSLSGLAGSKIDPLGRFRGWQELAQTVDAVRDETANADNTLLVVTAGRDATSYLAFHLPDQPQVFHYRKAPVIEHQYDVWGGPQGVQGRDALILTDAAQPRPPESLARQFKHVAYAGRITIDVGHDRRRDYRLWRGENWR